MVVEGTGDHFVCRLHNEVFLVVGQDVQFGVDDGGGFFEDTHSPDDLARHGFPSDIKIDERPRGLCAKVTIGGNLDLPHAVRFHPVVHSLIPSI